MKRTPAALCLLLALFTLASCAKEVGDSCESNTECGLELTCDLSQPEGYCTASPCRPNECPTEAACIAFPDESSFCMKRCEADDDCRSGYVCVGNYGDVAFCNASPFLGSSP